MRALPALAAIVAACVDKGSTATRALHQPSDSLVVHTIDIAGKVVGADGSAISEADVAIFPAGEFAIIKARTSSSGEFRVQARPGTYFATATARGWRSGFASVLRKSQHELTVELVLDHGAPSASVRGRVRRSDGTPVAAAAVRIERWEKPAKIFITTTDASGAYETVLPAGSPCVVSVLPGQYVSPPQTVACVSDHTLDFVGYDWRGHAVSPSWQVLDWIRTEAIPLATVDPRSNVDDLGRIRTALGTARIIALGEATHGTREFHRLKHRVIKYLIENDHVSAVAYEVNLPEAFAVDDYIRYGTGTAAAALASLHFWIIDTLEVLELVEWIRVHNANRSPEKRVRFYGIDSQYTLEPAKYVQGYFGRHGRTYVARAENLLGIFAQADPSEYGKLSPQERKVARAKLRDLLLLMDQHRTELIASSGAEEWARVRQAVAVIDQAAHLRSLEQGEVYREVRDRSMAQNVRWIADQQPAEGRIVVSAANGHISMHSLEGVRTMGYHLRQQFGRDYLPIALTFGSGSFQARDGKPAAETRGVIENVVSSPPEYFFEAALERTDLDLFVLDLRNRPRAGPVADWFAWPRPTREYGATFLPPDTPWFHEFIDQHYDMVAFVRNTTRARPTPTGLRGPPAR
jgi:erythromycin esterase